MDLFSVSTNALLYPRLALKVPGDIYFDLNACAECAQLSQRGGTILHFHQQWRRVSATPHLCLKRATRPFLFVKLVCHVSQAGLS